MAIDRSKLQRMYKLMADNGYTQDYNTFEKKFTGDSNYANRKAVYDLFTKNGADLGGSYEEFMRKLQKPRATKPQQQPKTALGRAQQSVAQQKWGGYGGAVTPMQNDSELVRGLKNADAAQRLQVPVSYAKPGAVKQMVKQTRERQHVVGQNVEQAGRRTMQPLREEEKKNRTPVFDTGNKNLNQYVVNTQGQMERQMMDSGREIAGDHLGDYISYNIRNEFDAAAKRGLEAESALSKASPFASMVAGKAYNDALDPDMLIKNLSKKAESDMANILSDPKVLENIGVKAAAYGVDPEEYVNKIFAPGLQAKIAEEFEKSELSRNMPKSTAEYIIRGVNDSMIGTILSMSMMSKKQRQYAQQGMAMTDNGENPDVNPNMGARVARGTLSFVADAPVFGAAGKAGAAVAGKVFGNGVAQMARVANSSLGGRIARMAGSGMVSQGVTGVLYGSTNAAVQNYSTGDDTSIGNTVKLMTMGGVSEGASWATMGGIGGAVGGSLYNVSGFKRIPAKVFQIAMEGVGMHMGGNVAKMIEGHDTDWLSVEGNLEACANVVALKLTHARLPKRYAKDGKKESYLGMVARNLYNLTVSDRQRTALGGYTFTNEEKEQLFGSANAPRRKEYTYGYDKYDVPLTRSENLIDWALRTKKTTARGKGEESYNGTDAEFVKTAYDEIMADNTIPWDTKAKFSALVMGTVPSARPMMDHIAIERDERGAYVGEYSLYGELLSKNRYKTADEYVSIKYNLGAKKENQRLSNAYGAAQIKDEKAAQETLETVAETFGFTAEQLKAAMDKDPLKRSEEEQNACVALRKAYEGEQFPEGTLHPDQSQTEGKDVVEENNLGTENPNNEAVAEVLNNMNNAEKAFNAALESNDVLKQEYERLAKEGLSEPQIYMELFNSGLTQEQLAPFADYINAKAKAVGMYRGTEQKIAETVQKHVEQWSYKGELNGEKQEGGQMVFVKDNKGRLLIVGAGDVAFDNDGRARESVGDMLSVLDAEKGEMDFVSVKDVKLERTVASEEYAKEYQELLEVKNSEVYAQNEQQKQMENAAGGVTPEGGKPEQPITEQGNAETTVQTGEANKPVRTFADGSPVPMTKDSKGRETAAYSMMTPEQGAEWIEKTFGEDAEAVADGKIERAKKDLSKAEKMDIDMTADDADVLEAKTKKKAAIEAAQKELELYTNIKMAMVEKKVKATMEKENTVGEVDSASRVSDAVREKFEKSKKIPGRRGSITLPDGTKITGQYFYGEVSGLTPSHDPFNDFKQNEGFPVNEDGSSSNSRSYKDKESRLFTEKIGRDFGGQALKNVPVVQDGILLSGNGTTMGKQLAERYGTDGKYYESLSENAEGFGWTPKQIEEAGFKGTVYFVPDKKMPLTSKTFDLFNKQETKSIGNTEQSVKNAKVLDTDEISAIVSEIEGSGSLDAFFNNPTAINSLLKRLIDKGVIGLNEVAGLREGENKLSASGKDFVRNLLLGSVFSEDTIRMMGADAGLKSKALNGIRAVLDNMKLGDYALRGEIDKAVQLVYEARQQGGDVDAYLRTPAMFGENAADRYDPISQAIALALDGKAEDFRDLMMAYNRNAAHYADANQLDVFGDRPTKEEFINEFLKLRNWKNYETRRSENEGNGDVGGTQGSEPETSGGNEQTEGEGVTPTGAGAGSPMDPDRFDRAVEQLKTAKGEERERILDQMEEYVNEFAESNGYDKPVVLRTKKDLADAAKDPDDKFAIENMPDDAHNPGYYEDGKIHIYLEGSRGSKELRETFEHESVHADNDADPSRVEMLISSVNETGEITFEELEKVVETLSNSDRYSYLAEKLDYNDGLRMLADEALAHLVAHAYKNGIDAMSDITKNSTLLYIAKKSFKFRENERQRQERESISGSTEQQRKKVDVQPTQEHSGTVGENNEGKSGVVTDASIGTGIRDNEGEGETINDRRRKEGLAKSGDKTLERKNLDDVSTEENGGALEGDKEGKPENDNGGSPDRDIQAGEEQREVEEKAIFEQRKAEYLKALKEGKTGKELENAKLHYKFSFLDYQNIMGVTDAESLEKLWKRELESAKDSNGIGSEEALAILPKKEEKTFDPIGKAAENYKKDHPLTDEEIRSSDVDDIAKDMAVDYLNGEVTDDLHRAVYESIYEKVKDAKMKNATKQADNKTETTETPNVEASASPIEGMKNAAEKFAKEKEAAVEAMGEVKKPQQKADDAAVEASNKKVNDLWNDLLKAGREDLSASFIGLNARQLEVLPKLVSAMAENAYLRIKRGMHNLEDVVKEMRKEFAPAAQVFKKEDVDAIYEQMMNIRYRDGEQRMSLKEWADYYEKISPKHKEELVGDSKEAEERKIREKKFIDKVNLRLGFGQKINGIVELRKMAEECGLKDVKDTDLQELAETAIVQRARGIASSESTNNTEKFKRIKKLYENQPSLNQRDSERVMKQQYSTPAPYAFLADMYVKAGIEVKSALEPSAGNGMLTIGLPKDAVHVNDIDAQRLANLQRQGFKNVTSQDGTQPFADKDVDVVVTNPPFGSATPRDYDGYTISSLEGQMAINALESMKDNGRAAIIIGGKTEYAKNGSLNPKDKAFLGYLYSHYNVEDVINVDGSLYAKQGTTYPTRIILINGRRFDENAYPPVKDKARAEAVKSYDELYKRINDDILRSGRMDSPVGEGGEDANAKPNRPSVADANEEGVRAGGNGGGEQKPSVRTGGVHDKTAEPVSDNVLGTEGGTKPGENGGLPDGAIGANGAGTEPTSSKEPTTGTNKQRGNEPGGNGRPNTQPNADETTDAGNGGRPRGQLERVDKPVRGLSAEKVAYTPRSENPFTLKAVMPADQQEAVNKNLEKLGDADQFLVDELGYNDKADLYAHLAAEQVDSVALALQQAKKGNAFIIGDMTGIGKGRQAASLIRYAKNQGQVPVYFTKTAGLLSDVYRDLVDIGSKELRPFVFGSAKEAAITDADGNVVFALPSKNEVKRVLDYIEKNGELPKEYDYVLTTYSQVSNGVYEFDENGNRKERKLAKGKKFGAAAISGQARRDAIEKLMKNGYLILDESHTAGGDSGQGNYFQHIIQKAKNVTFFSATFAKRPDNMPIYALRTAMNQGGMKASDLIDAVKRGGATLQEIMSQALTQCGQMIRRERDMTGVTIDWKAIDDPEVVAEQREQYDSIIGLFNDIINFQRTYVSAYVDRRNEELAEVQSSMGIKRGTEALGIKNQPFASKAFNTVQQVLLSLKAKSAAERAIDYLKQGMKPVIALNNTNESQTGNLALGEEMDAPDLGTSLKKGLEGTLRYTSKNAKDESESGYINLKDLGADAVEAYHALEEKIRKTSTGLSLSPIDVIKNELTKAGYKVGELTGRQTEFVYNENGTVTKVKRADTDKKKLAREFNDGQIDALILNKSAATGISLHASSKYADQRKRVMIVAQQQLDVNDEVQMRGRIDRTGQVARGAYEYVVSLIPAEQRLLMMFKAKLKSLDANTTSSQKSKFNEMEVADITNKYGDKVVKEYMAEHLDLYARMADPFGWEKSYGADLSTVDPQKLVSSSDGMNSEAGGDANKLLGRMALLKVKEQEKMLQEIGDLYAAEIQRLNEMGENDLEITELPLKAKTLDRIIWKEGTEPGGDNAFADNTYIEKVNMAVLKKPMKAEEVKKAQDGLTGGKSWDEYRKEKLTAAKEYFDKKIAEATQKYEERAVKAATKVKEKYIKEAKKGQKETGVSDEQIEKTAGYQYENAYNDEKTKLDEVVKNLKAKYGVFERALETFNTEDAFVLPTDMNNPAELSGFGNSYGRLIDIKITDNFSPNASTISFATLDGRRKITFPINGKAGLGIDKVDVIEIIDRQTRQASSLGDKNLRVLSMDASNWDKLTSNESRKDGYIITGNLLQGLIDTKAEFLGAQLVKYTTDTGEVKTGILLSGNVKLKNLANEKPINSVAEKFELPSNKGGITEVTSSDGDVKIEQSSVYTREESNYNIRVPKSNKKGGKYFLDKELLQMVVGGNFETRGNTMFAQIKTGKLKDVLDRLSELGVKVKEESKVHYRMELGNTFSDSKEHFDAVRDRAVEEKGIVMPNLNKEKVKVVEVEKSPFGDNIETSLKNAREWAKENLVTTGKTEMPIMRDGTSYTISKRAVEKYLSESAVRKSENLDIHLSVLPKLTDVVHESIEAEIHPDYKKGEDGIRGIENGYGEGILVHRLYGAVELDGKMYRVKTTMQEFRGGEENKPHSYEVTKIELLDSPGKRENPDRPPLVSSNNSKNITSEGSEKANESDSLPLNSATNGYISTAKLLQGVEKSYDSGKKLLDESKDLTDGETFFRKEGDGVVTPEKTSNAMSERIIKTVEKVAKRTGGKVKMVNSVEEIENPKVRKDIENGKQVTGWYDEKTGEVHLYMPNIHDTYTAEKTVWHETVGHKGMRGLLGDKFDSYMRDLWMDLDNPINAELRAYVKEKMNMNHLGFYDAIEEFIAKSAEDGKGEPGFWNYIKNKVTDALHEIGYRVSPNVKDVKYMLWLAKNVQKHGDSPLWKLRAEAVRWKIEHEKTEYTKIEGGELYDNDGKSHDFESMSREEWLEATDGEIHYRTTPSAATALDRYHHALDRHSYMATEAFMDNMLSLKKLMEAIDPSIRKIEDVASSMNPYLMQNITEGKMSDKSKLFEIRYMDPLSKAMSSVLDSFDGKKVEDRIRNFNLYMIRKHGLERNRVLFVRDKIREERKVKSEESNSIDALETAWKGEKYDLRKKLDSGQIDLKEYYRQMDEWIVTNLDKDFKAEEHDYSGMHGLQGIADKKAAYDDAGAIDEVMSQEASMESMKKGSVADFWKKVKAATDYSVNSDYESGLISQITHDGVLGMFDWYVPLRKFDEATAEDVYGYVTEMGDPSNYIGTTLMNAKGRKSLSNVEILAQIGLMGNRAIRNGGQNTIKQAFARFVRNSGEQNLVKETKVWVEKIGTDRNGNDIWEEAYPKIPEGAEADEVAEIVDAFETDMRAKQAKGEAKSLSNSTDIGFKFQRAKDKSQHFVDVKIAGRTHRFVVLGNPRAAQALNGMLENGKASQKWLQTVTRWMAMASTSWSPEFVMRNIVRDAEFASSHVRAKEGGIYAKKWARYYGELNPLNVFYNEGAGRLKSMKMKDFKNGVGFGLYARYREGTLGNSKMERYFKEFMENGGETGFVQLFSMHDMEKSYKSIVEKESAKGAKKVMVNAMEVLKNLGKNVESLNEVAENMARFATYCTSRDLGRSAARSAYDAKEVSTNFNRHGSGDEIKSFKNGEMSGWQKTKRNTYGFVAGYLRNYSMFFNAGIQSTNLLFKNIKRAPVGTAVAMTSAPFALALIMAAVNNAIIQNEDDKDRGNVKDPYGELPDYIRRNNLCIYVGNNKFVTVPLAIELRAFYSLGDLAAGQTFAKNVKSQRNIAMDAVGCMSQLFPVTDFLNNPNYEKSLENGVGMTIKGLAPTAIVPFIEWWLNNDWKGAPIRRTGDKTELNPAWQNAYNNVPARLVDLNKWVNAKTNNIAPGNPEMKGNDALDWITDPSMLNHFYSSWSGGMGTFVQRTAGLGAKATTGKADEIEVGDVPFLRSLFYTPREQSSMARTKAKWYNYKEEMEQTIANNDKLKSKNVPTMKRIENAAVLEKFEGSPEQRKVNIIKNAEKRMRHWNTMKKKWADDKKQVDFANHNIEMIMQEAVEELDRIE
jgi:hypothetical protein